MAYAGLHLLLRDVGPLPTSGDDSLGGPSTVSRSIRSTASASRARLARSQALIEETTALLNNALRRLEDAEQAAWNLGPR